MTMPWTETLSLTKTDTGGPLDDGDLVVVHVDRKGVICPTGWTRTAAVNASGEFFWHVVQPGEETTIRLVAPDGVPFQADTMALWVRLQSRWREAGSPDMPGKPPPDTSWIRMSDL